VNIGIVGVGRMGTAAGVLLERAGHHVVAVSGRGPSRDRASRFLPDARFVDPAEAARDAELVLIAMPDDLIGEVAASIATEGAWRAGQYVVHGAGALTLDVLQPARDAGATCMSIHPLQTIPDVGRGLDRLPGSAIAVAADDDEGYRVAERIAEDMLGEPFRLSEALRPLYHAGAVLASNDLVALSATAARLFEAAGVPDPARAMRPLQEATLANLAELGAATSLTGPVVRGDAGTVERNLRAIAAHVPDAVATYVVLARAALELATQSERLRPEDRVAIEAVLARWS
jgi:predicted short-subunit dehydrogenase-like oxidoreductase (DUF2520 family)